MVEPDGITSSPDGRLWRVLKVGDEKVVLSKLRRRKRVEVTWEEWAKGWELQPHERRIRRTMSHRHFCDYAGHDWQCVGDCECFCGLLMEGNDHGDCPVELRACPKHRAAHAGACARAEYSAGLFSPGLFGQ